MAETIDPSGAREALAIIDRRRNEIAEEIGIPGTYWLILAVGWVVLGVLADYGNDVVTSVATITFGMFHAVVATSLLTGRNKSASLSVRAELVGNRLRAMVLAAVTALVAVTVVGALIVAADGAAHPATIASTFVALMTLGGGPRFVRVVRPHVVRGNGL